ncbi:hypothetical protein ACIP4Y_34075 [Streptomyces sp. NPDC088810]
MARQLARGMGSFFKECDCTRQTHCPRSVREAMERYEEKRGTTKEG